MSQAPSAASVQTDRRLRIYEFAEALFAADGFDKTSLRAIAKRADVDLALIAHHFGSKRSLLKAVLSRRAKLVHDERLEMLQMLRSRGVGEPTISELVDAFLRPLFRRAQADHEWRNYLRLMSRLSVEREWVGVVGELYDQTAKYFVDAMRLTVPGASDRQLYWAYHFLLGGFVFTGADSGRIDRLSDGLVRSGDFIEAYPFLVKSVSAGIRSILADDD